MLSESIGTLVYVAILAAALVSIGVVLGREERNPTKSGLSCAMDSNPNRRLENEILALWLAPIVSTLPLIPFFSLRFSPLFLGTLMADRGPTTWPWIGPVFSAAGVVFDGTILGYAALFVVALPVYLILRRLNQLSPVHIVLVGAIAGIIASQFVAYVVQHRGPFKQPGLTEFALSWSSFLLGGLSGGAAGWFVAHLSGYRKQFETELFFSHSCCRSASRFCVLW